MASLSCRFPPTLFPDWSHLIVSGVVKSVSYGKVPYAVPDRNEVPEVVRLTRELPANSGVLNWLSHETLPILPRREKQEAPAVLTSVVL